MTEEELKNPDNWLDGGLTDHFYEQKDIYDIASECVKLLDAEHESPIHEMITTALFVAAKFGVCSLCSGAVNRDYHEETCQPCLDKKCKS